MHQSNFSKEGRKDLFEVEDYVRNNKLVSSSSIQLESGTIGCV